MAVLIVVERSVREPILMLRLFRDRERFGAYAARALFLGAMLGFFLLTSQFLQDQWGWSPLAAGLGFFPMTVVNFVVAIAVPRLQRRVPGAILLVTGLGLAGIGMAGLGLVGPHSTYLLGIGVPMTLIGAGQGLAFGPLTASGIVRVDPAHAGAASGVVNSVHQLGGAVGMSLVVALTSTYPAAMKAGALLVGAAVAVSAVLVIPAARVARVR